MELAEILEGIESDDPEAFLGSGELLRVHSIGLNGTGVVEPYSSMYRERPLNSQQVEVLTLSLKRYIEAGRLENAMAAAHALGERRDPSLVPWLQSTLKEVVHRFSREGDLLGQLMAAMDNCGERVTIGNSFTSTEYEKNLADAVVYLKENGLVDD